MVNNNSNIKNKELLLAAKEDNKQLTKVIYEQYKQIKELIDEKDFLKNKLNKIEDELEELSKDKLTK
jgi:cell division protein FtsB